MTRGSLVYLYFSFPLYQYIFFISLPSVRFSVWFVFPSLLPGKSTIAAPLLIALLLVFFFLCAFSLFPHFPPVFLFFPFPFCKKKKKQLTGCVLVFLSGHIPPHTVSYSLLPQPLSFASLLLAVLKRPFLLLSVHFFPIFCVFVTLSLIV